MANEILDKPTAGKRYKVKGGDRITTIAPQAGVTPKAIIDANLFLIEQGRKTSLEDLPTIYAGDILVIPANIQSERPKQARREFIENQDKFDFALVIEGYQVPVESGTATIQMNSMADEFSAIIAWDPGADLVLDEKTEIGSDPECQLYLGGELLIDGYIPDITQQNGDRITKTLVGYSRTVHLVDSMLSPPYSKDNISLEQRCQDLAWPFGIDVIISDAAKNLIKGQFKRVSGKPTEKIFDHLVKLARQRGALLTNDKFGNLLIDVSKTKGESIDIINEDEGRVSSNWTYRINNRERYQTYRAIGQSPGSNKNAGIAVDNSIGQPRVLTFQASEADTGDLLKAALWRKNKTVADSYQVPIKVADWYTSEGKRWPTNDIITVASPTMNIPEGKQLLIQKVVFEFGGKPSATLYPVPLFAYSTEELKTEKEMKEAISE